jgi:uncharacterized membrane protein YhaH (DUF805 family)
LVLRKTDEVKRSFIAIFTIEVKMLKKFFSYKGRINRLEYLCLLIFTFLFSGILIIIFAAQLIISDFIMVPVTSYFIDVALFFLQLSILILLFLTVIKRLRDINVSLKWSILLIFPFIFQETLSYFPDNNLTKAVLSISTIISFLFIVVIIYKRKYG